MRRQLRRAGSGAAEFQPAGVPDGADVCGGNGCGAGSLIQ